jgi:hypothetical protein
MDESTLNSRFLSLPVEGNFLLKKDEVMILYDDDKRAIACIGSNSDVVTDRIGFPSGKSHLTPSLYFSTKRKLFEESEKQT